MYCLSINHKNADSEIRSEVAFTGSEKEKFYDQIKTINSVSGLVLLNTCNRSEIYFTGSASFGEVEKAIANVKNLPVAYVKKHFMRFQDEQAFAHLYNVACGLDSVVVGEVEIIRQLKEAYKDSVENKLSNQEINISFQDALSYAKDVAEKSLMTKLPVSVGTLTAEAVLEFVKNIKEPKILILGASGDIGGIVLNNILDFSDGMQVVCTARKHRIRLNTKFDDSRIEVIDYSERYLQMYDADVIISATSSPHYTFIEDEIDKQKVNNKKHLFIDLAIPKDVDPDIGKCESCIIKNIDYIKELAKDNNEKKTKEAKKIQLSIKEKVDCIRKNLLFRNYMAGDDAIANLMLDKSSAKIIYQLRDSLEYDQFERILDILKEDKDGIFSIYDSIG